MSKHPDSETTGAGDGSLKRLVRSRRSNSELLPAAESGWQGSGRRTPYTQRGIERLKCIRCGEKAATQWQVCADDRRFRPICLACDIALNRMVLSWMHHPRADEVMTRYIERVAGGGEMCAESGGKRPNEKVSDERRT